MILSTFLLSLYSQLFLLNCQNSRDFRKPVGNFPKEIWTRSLVYSGLVYSRTRTTYFSFCQGRKIRLFLTRFQHHSPVFVSHSQTLSFNQRSTKGTVLKSDNLQYTKLGRWDDCLIDQVSAVPSITFFMISCKILCKNNTWTIRRLVEVQIKACKRCCS